MIRMSMKMTVIRGYLRGSILMVERILIMRRQHAQQGTKKSFGNESTIGSCLQGI